MKASQFSLSRLSLLLLTFFFLSSFTPALGQGGAAREALRQKLKQRLERRKSQLASQPSISSKEIDTSHFTSEQKALLKRGWDPALVHKYSQGRAPARKAKANLNAQIAVLTHQLKIAFQSEVLRKLDDGWSSRIAMYELKDYATKPDTLLTPTQVQFFDQHLLYFQEPDASHYRGHGHLLPNKAWIFDGEIHLVRPAITSSGGIEMELRIIDDPTKLLEALFGRRQLDEEVFESLSSFSPVVTENLAESLRSDENLTYLYNKPKVTEWVNRLHRCSIKPDYRNILIAKFFSNDTEYRRIPVIDKEERYRGRGDVPTSGYSVNTAAEGIRDFGKGFSSLFGKYSKMVGLEENFDDIADSFYKAPLEAAAGAAAAFGGVWIMKQGVSGVIQDAREGAQLIAERGGDPYDGGSLASSSSSSVLSEVGETTTRKSSEEEVKVETVSISPLGDPKEDTSTLFGTTVKEGVFQRHEVRLKISRKGKGHSYKTYVLRHNITKGKWRVFKGPNGWSSRTHSTQEGALKQLHSEI